MDNDNKEQVTYWLTTKDLLKELRKYKLPSTWAAVKQYFDLGLLPPSKNVVQFHRDDSPTTKGDRVGTIISRRGHPIYTKQDIANLVGLVRQIKIEEEERKQLAKKQAEQAENE